MHLPLYNREAEVVGEVDVRDSIFAVPMNQDLLHQVAVSLMANKRQNIAHTKGRSEVRGGGKKPWKQKGTGRARHGSIRSPIWKGGGVTHGPSKEKDYSKKINRKVARKALAIALSDKSRVKRLVVLDSLTLEHAKTKELAHVLKRLSAVLPDYVSTKTHTSSILLVSDAQSGKDAVVISARNIPHVEVVSVKDLNALHVLSYKYAIVLKDALPSFDKIQKVSQAK